MTNLNMQKSSRRVRKNPYRNIFFLLTVFAMLISACKPGVAPATQAVPEVEKTAQAPVIVPTPTLAGLPVVDAGAPLPVEVVETQPSPGQELSAAGKIRLTFNQPMDIDKTNAAWVFEDEQGNPVSGEIQWPSTRSLEFTPAEKLATGSRYLAKLGEASTSAGGASLGEALTFAFTTFAPLQVSQVFPADNTRDVANNAVITVIFNRPVVPLVIAEEQKNHPQPLVITPELPGEGEWVNTSVYAYKPNEPLKGNTTYQVTIKAGLSDVSGETQVEQDFSWKFTTIQPSIESLAISSGPVNLKELRQNVLLDESFTLRFFQPMDQGSTEQAFSIIAENGEKVLWERLWNDESTQVIITPTQRLALGTDFTLTLDDKAQAADGGSLKAGLAWSFRTVPAPAVIGVTPMDGSRPGNFNSELRIRFASPMKIDTVKERIQITPSPAEKVEWWYNEWDWSIASFALKPSTRYEVRFLPGMEDIYGNTIQTSQVVRFTTGAYEPNANLEMPYEPSIMRQDGPQEFYVGHRNIKSLQVRLFKISLEDFVGLQTGALSYSAYEPEESELVWQEKRQSRAMLNERVLEKFTPLAQDGQGLENGYYFLALNSPEVTYNLPYADTRLIVVATASLNLKTSATDALVWLTGLSSGSPVSGVTVKIYEDTFKVVGEGKTDQKGMLYLELPEPQNQYGIRFAVAENDQVFAFTSSNWGSGFSLWDYGIWGSYFSPANQPTVYMYTERPIYRPGQPVYFKGIVRLDDDLDYRIPEMKTVRISIENFQEEVFNEELDLNEMGSFAGKFTLDEDAALGYYSFTVTLPNQEPVSLLTFNVAEYRRPEFQVQVSAEPENTLNGDKFTAQVQADYYSGGGVDGAQVKWSLVSAPYTFTPPDDLSMFSFSDVDEYSERFDSGEFQDTVQVAEGEGQTDRNGAFSAVLPVDLNPSGNSRAFTFEATLTDISQNAVSNRATVIGHRAQVYPGIRPLTYIGKTGDPLSFEIVAVDWDGELLANQKVSVEIVERRWYSVQEQDPEGRVQWTSTVEEIPVTTLDDLATNERGRVEASFTPAAGGIYRARVKSLDGKGNEGRASAYVWVAGDEFIPWRQTNDRSFDLVADRTSYAPGDTAEILIASPFQGEAYALVTVERGKLHAREVVLLENNSTVYRLPISAGMAPNVFLSVIIVKGVDETNPRPNFKMGMVELKVNPEQRALQVEISSDPAQAGPGETVLYTVKTMDYSGKPQRAEVSLSLSDLATLSLMPPNSAPILDAFYARRTLGVWTSVPISLDIEDYNLDISEKIAEGQGMGSGGAKGEGDLGVVEVRQDFPDTAFWEAFIDTGEQGQASVSITLPDNLTTWRMDARAVTETTLVGQATYDLMSTKPLLVRPQTPRFFVAGDQARLGAAIHNNTLNDLTVTAGLEGSGLNITTPASQEILVESGSQAYVTWDTVIQPTAERVDLVFSVKAGSLSDASRPTIGSLDNQGLPVYRYEVPETVGTSGIVAQGGSVLEAISLPEAWQTTQGSLDLSLSPSLAAGMTDGLAYLEHYQYECIEQTISRFLPNVLTTQALKSAGLSDPQLEANLKEQVGGALQKLYNWQNANGGWSWWRADKSDPLTSAYVILGLVEAKEAGYQVNDEVLERGVKYLQTQISSGAKVNKEENINRQAFLLYALARAGKPNVSTSIALYDKRQNAALYARAFMAHTLYLIDAQDPRLDTLLSDLNSAALVSATGSHWEEKTADRWNWNTDTRTTAIVLSALSLIDPENPLNANAVRWLMSSRREGHWLGTQETAWTLMALTRWMVASGELQADYQYGVALNGEQIGGGVADQASLRETLDLKVDIAELLSDEANRLVIARDDGPGNLYYTAHLNVWLPVNQVRALDQGLIVSRNYYRLDDLQTPVATATQGELLLGRLTLVAPSAVHYAIVEDALPAGLEAVDQSLNTSPQNQEVPQEYSWEDVFWKGWGWWYFSQIQYRDEKVMLSAEYLPAGTYVFTYMVRAGTVGEFSVIPPTAQEFYFPEVYGRGEGSMFSVEPAK